MNNEAQITFCFIQSQNENNSFIKGIEQSIRKIFSNKEKLTWQLMIKEKGKLNIINVKISGLCTWRDEQEAVSFIDDHATSFFWEYLQGFQIIISPLMKGCECCGST